MSVPYDGLKAGFESDGRPEPSSADAISHSRSARINHLPAEILGTIFESTLLLLETEEASFKRAPGRYRMLATLLSVCSWWHEVSVSAPTLWAWIQWYDGCIPGSISRATSDLFLSRSGNASLRVQLNVRGSYTVQPWMRSLDRKGIEDLRAQFEYFLSSLRPHAHRVSEITVSVPRKNVEGLLWKLLPPEELRHFRLRSLDISAIREKSGSTSHAPIQLEASQLFVSSCFLPVARKLQTLRLVTGDWIPPAAFHAALSCCSHLRELDISGSWKPDTPWMTDEVVSLPELEIIRACGDGMGSIRIDAPSLREIEIQEQGCFEQHPFILASDTKSLRTAGVFYQPHLGNETVLQQILDTATDMESLKISSVFSDSYWNSNTSQISPATKGSFGTLTSPLSECLPQKLKELIVIEQYFPGHSFVAVDERHPTYSYDEDFSRRIECRRRLLQDLHSLVAQREDIRVDFYLLSTNHKEDIGLLKDEITALELYGHRFALHEHTSWLRNGSIMRQVPPNPRHRTPTRKC